MEPLLSHQFPSTVELSPPTTRPTPARRMHGWPAVADLTTGRPIRIALVQVGAAPTAQAHCKLSQHISQQSDPFLCSLKPRGAPIAWLVFRTGLFCHRQSVAQHARNLN